MVAGDDCVWIGGPDCPKRYVAITGIDNHQIPSVRIGTVRAYAMSNRGPVIMIFNETAYTGRHPSIVFSTQLEHHHNRVDDRSVLAGGTQRITTNGGYIFPLFISQGLAYIQMRPYTAHEYATNTHVIMTSDQVWDLSYSDNEIDPLDHSLYENTPDLLQRLPRIDYDVHGEYNHAFHADVPISDPIPPNFPISDHVPNGAPADVTAPVPTATADAARVPSAHSVQYAHGNTFLSPDPMDDLASNRCAEFDAFTAGCLFEDAIENYQDQDQFFSADATPESAALWLNDAEYYHHESVARRINAAMRSQAPSLSAADLFDLHETNTHSVHELEFLANGSPRIHTPSAVDSENMRPYFAWQTTDIIEATFKNSTQYGFMLSSSNGKFFTRYRSPNPGANVFHIYDDFLTDSICTDTPAIDGGETLSQCFFGRKSKSNHGRKIKTTKYYLKALQDCVRKWGPHLTGSFATMRHINLAIESLIIFGSYGLDYGKARLNINTRTVRTAISNYQANGQPFDGPHRHSTTVVVPRPHLLHACPQSFL